MSDRWAFFVACATALGAWLTLPVPRGAAVVLVVVVVVTRAPWVLAVAAFVWASASGAVALAALHSEPRVANFEGEVTLVGDPVPLSYGARVDVRVEGRRYEAVTDRSVARRMADHLAGERAVVRGSFTARPADAPWLDARHIAGRLRIDDIGTWREAPAVYAFANGVRRTLERGALALPYRQRALYTGLVYGDDRAQSALLADDFRAGGFGHLLAVSGQNVAFVLAAAGPLLRRVSYRLRWPVTLFVLVLFVLVTRAEPSVLRAAVMAAIATRAAAAGRTAPGVRVLALAVTALLCVDPLLVHAVGFQLSVAASLGILLGSRRVADMLRGPRVLREMLGVTIAAQVAVAPISVLVFGGVPLASIPANLLALPAAGPVMVWGLTGGLAAGVFGGSVAMVVQAPMRGLVWWIASVASHASRAPLGTLRATHVAVLGAAAAIGILVVHLEARGRTSPIGAPLRRGALAMVAVVLIAPVLAAHSPPPAAGPVARGVWLWRNAAVVVEIDGTATSADALGALREHDVGAIDVLVVRTATSPAAVVARDLRTRYRPTVVWAPPLHQIRGATTPMVGEQADAGGLVVEVLEVGDRVRVRVRAV